MFTLDPALLSALAHPCIGALIGYLVSKIAIRMLFRPLRPWRLFGIRVPLTPGVIPARRRALAAGIGELAGRQLLTGKDIGAAIAEASFQAHLAELAEREVRQLFTRDLGPLPDLVPSRFRSYAQVGVKTLKYRIGEGINSYLAGQEFEERFAAVVAARLDDLGGQEIDALNRADQLSADEDARQTTQETMVREGLALLRSGAGERMAHAVTQAMIDALLAHPLGRLHDIVPHGVRRGLVEYLVSIANRLLLQEVPELAASMDLRKVVTDRVDGLSPLQLERLLLAVMGKRFIFIHLFGALLGFLLGLINLALATMM